MSSIFWMLATHAVEVEVDTETGVVRIVKVAAAHDVGRAINPTTCEQQIEGGVIMGLSNALFEDLAVRDGRIGVNGFLDYKLATMHDLPEIVPIIVESEHSEAPFGAKGIGEPAAAATAPAIANAGDRQCHRRCDRGPDHRSAPLGGEGPLCASGGAGG